MAKSSHRRAVASAPSIALLPRQNVHENPQSAKRARWATAAMFLATGLFCWFAAIQLFHYPLSGPPIPLHFERDTVWVYSITQSIIQEGWFLTNSRMGLPGTYSLANFPLSDVGHMAFLKLVGYFLHDPVDATNGYFFLTFFLAGCSATWALMRLGVRRSLAWSGGILFSLTPFHLQRSVGHLYLAGCYFVPVSIWALVRSSELALRPWRRPVDRELLLFAGVAFATAFFGVYYAFFFCMLLGLCTLFDAAAQRSWLPVRLGGAGLGLCLLGVLINVAPCIFTGNGVLGANHRSPAEAEVYGLKLVQMILPALGRVNDWAGQAAKVYEQTAPLVNENRLADQGFLGALALLALLFATFMVLVRPQAAENLPSPIPRLGALTCASLFFGTVGGLASVLSYLGFSYIRSTNRISIYIVFFGLCAGLLLLQQYIDRQKARPEVAAGVGALLAVVMLINVSGYPLSTDPKWMPIYSGDTAFFGKLEAAVPPGTRVLELPYLPFPEAGWGLGDYDHMRPFLTTQHMRFSFGAPRGSQADTWQSQITGVLVQDPQNFAAAVQQAGFDAILVNRVMARRLPVSLTDKLAGVIGPPVMESDNGEFAYYSLRR